ncbi:MAG: Holliday junction branch migration protein RuvA [Actinobacteria bacterium]|nr:Holliday junction branch migration protein RuvA [Actinomycetota bacterium]
MIARLTGKILEKLPTSLIIETGGVGFEVLISGRTYAKLPQENNSVSLNIHTHVREEEIKLIGFLNNDEKEIFLKLIGVSGISIKIALSSLSIYSVEEIKKIISKSDTDLLRRIPGVGKKLAERMIVEIRDRLEESDARSQFITAGENEKIIEVRQALKTLGYTTREVNEVLSKIKIEDLLEKKVEEILRLSLREM